MAATAHLDPATASVTSPSTRAGARRGSGARAIWLGTFCVYLVAGWNLAIVHHAVVGDAMARVANGYYVLHSRDPHLAAVGFVWNPLPSLVDAAILPISRWWPQLRTQGFAGNLTSAAAMAGAVASVWQILTELAVRPWARTALTALFAFHPLVLLYGSNGDSEAWLLLFLSLACLFLLRYLARRDLASLAGLGISLGLGYLTRQEFLAAGAATTGAVLLVAFREARGPRAHRWWSAATDASLAVLPLLFAIVCWAGSALVIVGTATSYLDVNAEQVGAARSGISSVVGGSTPLDRLGYFLGQLLQLEPAWSLLAFAALVLAVRRRDARILAPLTTFGAVAVAQGGLFVAGSTFGWLRFAITVVPGTVVVAGLLASPQLAHDASERTATRWLTARTILVVAGCLIAIPIATVAMTNPRWGREEAALVHLLPGYGWAARGASAYQPGWLDDYDAIAAEFAGARYRDGSVLTDTQYTFPLILKVDRPRVFVIPSDTDFERSLADPATYHVRFLLVSDGAGDSIAAAYPALRSADRTPIAKLVEEFRAGPHRLRLYRVTASVTGQPGTRGR